MAADERSGPDRIAVEPDFANIAVVRRFVRTALGSGDPDVASDLQLAASELVSNAIEHGRGGLISVDVDRIGDDVSVTVVSTGPAPRVGPVDDWFAAPPDSPTGRGLAIVRALADHVDVVHGPESLTVTVHRSVANRRYA